MSIIEHNSNTKASLFLFNLFISLDIMLPSTGYFKALSCPFYDSGLCERPYCHFRHVKKELQPSANEGIESGAILQKLVSAAVQKVLQQTEGTTIHVPITLDGSGSNKEILADNINSASTAKVTYNPTPISELTKINSLDIENNDETSDQRKRHIPVPYTPRKPASLPVKRSIDTNGTCKPFLYLPPTVKYTPGSGDSTQTDPYTPRGLIVAPEQYLPGIEKEIPEYQPKETVLSGKHNYVPSEKNSKKLLEYKPIKVKTKRDAPSVTYQPTPKSLVPCFSSDEDEPEVKKSKLSDLNDLDELAPEFDILDQILDEEKSNESKNLTTHEKENTCKEFKENIINKYNKSTNIDNETKHEHIINKTDKIESNKQATDRKELSSEVKSDQRHKPSKEKHLSSSEKVSHKRSSTDKKKAKSDKSEKERKSKDKPSHSKSKSSSHNKKHTAHISSKETEKCSKHSNHDTKKLDKSHHSHDKSHKSSRKSKEKKGRHKENTQEKNKSNNDISNCSSNQEIVSDEPILSDTDEESIALECKKIFEEYVPTKKVEMEEIEKKVTTDEEYIPVKKRISRTANAEIKIIPKLPVKPDYKLSAAQAMSQRLEKVREYHALKSASNPSIVYSKPEVSKTVNTSIAKIRIAHVPYASTLLSAKKTITTPKKEADIIPSTSSTIIQTNKKGSQRIAHIPNEKFIDRPGVLEPLGSKIPANIRSTYLNLMIDECLKIYLEVTDAYARAQHEELLTSKKCSKMQIYKNSAAMAVSRLRKEFQECNGIKKSGNECLNLQKVSNTVLGNVATLGSWSIEGANKKRHENIQEFLGEKFYKNIQKWLLTEEQLQENGFPRSHPSGEKGRAIIYAQNKKQLPPKGFLRVCCRCKKEYMVNKKGFAAAKEECIYHPNNKYRIRGEVKYQCCGQDGMSDGCCVAPTHVYDYIDYENLKGYIKTMPPETKSVDYGVYSLDCEMCYTTNGLDLTRVTVINSSCKVVYETLIKPLHPIIDYNTKYSGITEDHMSKVQTTLLEVQATLLTMFNSKTILIGHSLESDFKALKLIHDTVIDTSVLYPHKMGPPYKRALRNLCSEHLKKIIQNSVEGHDSAEDATVCMELLQYKLREDLKTR